MNFRKFHWLPGFILAAMLLSSCNIGATPLPTVDAGVIQTQAFGQVLTEVAQQATQTAAAIPPTPLPTFTLAPTNTLPVIPSNSAFNIATNTPFAFNTQQPGFTPVSGPAVTTTAGAYSTVTTKNGCNDGYLISESKPFDGTIMGVNVTFDKSWDFYNSGTCAWDEGYSFAFIPEFSTAPPYTTRKDYVIPKNGVFTKPGESRTFKVTLQAPKNPGEYTWYFKIKDDAGQYFGSLVWVKIVTIGK